MRRCLVALVLALLPNLADGASVGSVSVQEALLRAKPAVALVVAEVNSEVTVNCGTGEARVTPTPFRETGSGWFVNPNGWVITNGHVVSVPHRPPAWVAEQQLDRGVRAACLPAVLARRGLKPGERPEIENSLAREILAASRSTAKVKLDPSIYVILSNGVRLPATVAKYSPPLAGEGMSGQDLALLHLEAADMPSLVLADSARAKIGDPLHILGFPGVVLTHELLNASAKVEASVTNGAISGFKQGVAGQSVIQTDASAAWGNSGGPAVNSNGDVLGVLTFVSLAPGNEGGIVQGFNFVIPSNAVRDFLRDIKVSLTEPSRFNVAWHEGLHQYFTGNYAEAQKHLNEANRLLPELPDVRRVSAENSEKIQHPPPRPFPWAMVAAAVTLVSVGAVAGLVGLRWKRNRFRIRASDVARLLESSTAPPIILDVRDQGTYEKSPVRIRQALHVAPEDLETGAARLTFDLDRTVVAYCT